MVDNKTNNWVRFDVGGMLPTAEGWFDRGGVKRDLQAMGVRAFDAYDLFEIRNGAHEMGITTESLGRAIGLVAFTDFPSTEQGIRIGQALAQRDFVIAAQHVDTKNDIDWSQYNAADDLTGGSLRFHEYKTFDEVSLDIYDLVSMHMTTAVDRAVAPRVLANVH